TGLISLYTKCGDVETGKVLFGQVGRKDLISCNAMIAGFTCNGETDSAVRLFRQLLLSGEKVNPSTIVGMIPIHSPFGNLLLTDCIHGFSIKSCMVSRLALSTALTTIYNRLNETESVRRRWRKLTSLCDGERKNRRWWSRWIDQYRWSIHRKGSRRKHRLKPRRTDRCLSPADDLASLSLVQELKFEEFERNWFTRFGS
ncbi:Pentatricopeptide repeat-containing protein At4g30700, partial [Linum grandiflorum]